MKQTTALFLLLSIVLSSCSSRKSVIANQEYVRAIQLGAIVESSGLINHNLEIKTTPELKKAVRLSLQSHEFNKSSFKKYTRSIVGAEPSVQYHDSLKRKPQYLSLEIIDDVAVTEAINTQSGVLEYIESTKDSRMLTTISFMLPKGLKADTNQTFFLEMGANNTYHVAHYSKDKRQGVFSFEDLMVFDYKFSFFCWGKDKRGKTKVLDIVEESKSCANPLKRNPSKLNESKKLFDY